MQQCEKAIAELGADAQVSIVTDEATIGSYGVAAIQTPAVVMARYQLKSTKIIPEVPIIKEWLKDVQ